MAVNEEVVEAVAVVTTSTAVVLAVGVTETAALLVTADDEGVDSSADAMAGSADLCPAKVVMAAKIMSGKSDRATKKLTICDCGQRGSQARKVNGHIVVHGHCGLGVHGYLGGSQVGKYRIGGEFADVWLGLKWNG